MRSFPYRTLAFTLCCVSCAVASGGDKDLGFGYYVDKRNVYWGIDPIDGADVATFNVLRDSFIAVDQRMVYRSGRPLPTIDPATCKLILHDPYGYQVISDKNGVYLNDLTFLHADPATFKMVDKLTGKGEKHVFLVDTWHSTPVTVYWEGEHLVTETIVYEKGTPHALAIVKAVVTGDKLKDITFSPAPGQSAPEPVPDWQMNVFQREDMVKRIKAAGKLLQ